MIETTKIYGYDFEVYSKINWFCVTFINYVDRNNIKTIINNRQELIDFYNSHSDCVFVSYNGRQYDTGIFAGILGGISVGKVNDDIILRGKKPFQAVRNFNKYQLNDYDCIVKDKSLKQLEAFMGDDIRETEVDFNIERNLTEDEIDKTIKYNIHDVQEVLRVLDYTWNDFEGQIDVIEMYNLPLKMISKTKVQLATHVLKAIKQSTMNDEFDIRLPETINISDKYKFIAEWFINPKNWRYKEHLRSNDNQHPNQLICEVAGVIHVFGWGGVHGCNDSKVIFEGLILHADVGSMYPTTNIKYGTTSRKIENPQNFKQLRDFRLSLKAKGDNKNKALKPLINGVYGATKDKNNPMYDPLMANLTCVFGQLFILDIICRIEENFTKDECYLIQTNTDGIFLWCNNENTKNKVSELIHNEGKKIKMEFEIDECYKLIQKDVNNYIAFWNNGKYECKGKFVKYNTPLDNDVPILNEALRGYFIDGIKPEVIIGECNDLIKFQKVIKLSKSFNKVIHGDVLNGRIIGQELKEKVHRVFVSKRDDDGGIYKQKNDKGKISYEKYSDTTEHMFIDNGDVKNKTAPDYLNKQWYIDEAYKRIDMFLTKDEKKVNNTPNVLYTAMLNNDTFFGFIKQAQENKISISELRKYIAADCCKNYGKTKKLLSFIDLFLETFGKKTLRTKNLDDDKKTYYKYNTLMRECSTLSKTGKTYTFDNETFLSKVFEEIPDEDIPIIDIMRNQVELFGEVRYTNEYMKNMYFVLNTRDVIKPTSILYNIETGEYQYRKIKESSYSILPFYDGDIIKVKSEITQYEPKIIGKSQKGINIIGNDLKREYKLISTYEIAARGKLAKSINELNDYE